MSLPRLAFAFFGLLLVAGLSVACGKGASSAATPTLEQPPTPTVSPPRSLTICLGQEPPSLFPLNNPSAAARSVLSAVYDGPIDSNSYGYQPVILQTLPSLENGDAQLFPTSVHLGSEIVDADGTPVTLAAGTKVRPAGCREDGCAIVYDGKTEIQLDQMQATFSLFPGLTWSDGEPLTAADSVYAFRLASDPVVTGSSLLVERTQSYEATDDVTVQWRGKPGFVDPNYPANFWSPLPQHLWSQFSPDSLSNTEEAARTPLGWGPYIIEDWVDGQQITLTKNPRYFRAGEGLPKFDTLTFRFVPDAETAVGELTAGNCDILDPSIGLDGEVSRLRSMAEQNQLQALFTTTPVMEQLAFGILPAAYDNGNNPEFDRPDYLGDARVRQAIAMCVNRQEIVDSALVGLSSVPASFVPEEHPFFDSNAAIASFDVSAANALLEQAGWLDADNDPATPRQALDIPNIPNGTPLELDYLTTQAAQRVQVSTMIADALAQCGIKVNVQYLSQEALYAPGPDGPLFGRNFVLAEFAMDNAGVEPPCEWFSSSQVPNAANQWIGTNISGYSNPAFDVACQTVQQTLADEPEHGTAYHQAQSIFAEDLPVLPLYWRVKVAAARSEVCGFSLDPTASSALWNIEAFDSGASCQP